MKSGALCTLKFLTSWYFSFSSIHHSCCLVTESCLTLLRSHGLYITCKAPLSMELPRQEYWHGLPFPSLGDLPDSGIKFGFPAWRGGVLYHWATRESRHYSTDKGKLDTSKFISNISPSILTYFKHLTLKTRIVKKKLEKQLYFD